MSNGSRLSRKAELSLVRLQIHPPALMMQKHAWLCLSTSRLKSVKKKKKDRKKKIWRKMDAATCMSSGGCSISPLRDGEDDGIFSWGGDVCVCLCLSFIFILKRNWLLTCNSESVCLSTTLWCPAASVAFERAWVSLSPSNESHVERWLDP